MPAPGDVGEAFDEVVDAVVVGAGFAGLQMLYELRHRGFSVRAVEAGKEVGGTWYWNRYPGARCDVESVLYSYSFSPEIDAEWRWGERYAAQPEILDYLRFVCDRLDLRRDIQFERRVTEARFDAETGRWVIVLNDRSRWSARYCILATGPLSVSRLPDIPGIPSFEGTTLHTGRWPEVPVDLSGKRVGVVGSGSSGTQVIPAIAPCVARLHAFIRTPNFTVPARNHPLTPAHHDHWRKHRDSLRKMLFEGRTSGAGDSFMTDVERAQLQRDARALTPEDQQRVLEAGWALGGGTPLMGALRDVMVDDRVNLIVSDFVRRKIRETVKNPLTAESLAPGGFPIGAKRLCVDSGFYETFNRDNVELVDVRREPILQVTRSGIQTAAREITLDVLIFATGFDAMTGAILGIDIVGKDALRLSEVWKYGPVNYLGIAISGFPNLFMIGGPGSPSALSNVVASNERHVALLSNLMTLAKARGAPCIEVTPQAQSQWVAHCREAAAKTLYGKADSWYLGSNVPGKPRVVLPYAGGFAAYGAKCAATEMAGFAEFDMK